MIGPQSIFILGPTASGKTHFAVNLAHAIEGEIISADSRQVYRGMDIGTGKDLEEFTIDGDSIPYHLIDIRDAGYKFNVHEFQHEFIYARNAIERKGKVPVVVGGSGLYIQAVLEQYTVKQESPAGNLVIFGIHIDRDTRRERITKRLHDRLEEGMVEEVELLLTKGLTPEDLKYYGLEYKWITRHLQGELTRQEMISKLNVDIHRFAKRQMTWFRKMEREGYKIHWIEWGIPVEEKVRKAREIINSDHREN